MKEPRPFRISIGYLVAVVVIYAATACGWLVLGAITAHRSNKTDTDLREQVGQLWGGQHSQGAPSLFLQAMTPTPTKDGEGKPVAATVPDECRPQLELKPDSTRADANLALEHRRKGLLWYSTYGVRFRARYTFRNPTACPRDAQLAVPLPARGAIYDSFSVELDGEELPVQLESSQSHGATARFAVAPGQSRTVKVRYNSRGLDRWSYSFGSATSRARDFQLVVGTNFEKVDFPDGTLSPSHKARAADGWRLTWRFENILADTDIAVAMPHRINPGPLASEISLFAPVSLAFFFFVLLLVSVMKQVPLHPVHYAMLAAAFFAFHLLLAYLVDLVPLWLAFGISSVTSVGLVVSYLRLAVGTRFAMLWAGGAQLLYLVLFSLAFFFDGYTGLTITIFSVLTLFVVMQLTGRIDWSSRFGRPRPEPFEPGAQAAPPIYGSARRAPDGVAPEGAFSRVG